MMEEATGATFNTTRYNLRRTAARSRRWAELSVPGEQTATALEQTQREASRRTRSRMSRPPRQQGRNGNSGEGISRDVLPMQRSNEEQYFHQRPARETVVIQTPVRETSESSSLNGEVSNTHSQGTSTDISHISNTVSNATQVDYGRRDTPYHHNGRESAPRNHASETNDTRSHGSETNAPAVQGREVSGPENGGEINLAVQRGHVASRHNNRHRHAWSWSLADANEPDSDSGWTSLYQYRNLVIIASLTQQRREVQNLPEAAVNEEQVHSGLKCSICLLEFELNEIVNKLPCDHIYHKNCIIPWLEYHNNCPMCRRPVEVHGYHPVSPSRDSRSEIRLELVVRNGEVIITEHL